MELLLTDANWRVRRVVPYGDLEWIREAWLPIVESEITSDAGSIALEIECQAVKGKVDRGDPFLLLDCREPDEFALVRIVGAQLWPMSDLPDRLPELAPHRKSEIVVYCHHGVRSLHVAMWLRQQGFTRATSMMGGIDRWALEIDRTLPRY
jgi:adenylyltransferase/sulfurtransferase